MMGVGIVPLLQLLSPSVSSLKTVSFNTQPSRATCEAAPLAMQSAGFAQTWMWMAFELFTCGSQTFLIATSACGTGQCASAGVPAFPSAITSPLGPCAAVRSKWQLTFALLQESFVRPLIFAVTATGLLMLFVVGRANPFGVMSVTGVGVPVQTSSPSLSSRKTVSVTVQLVKFTPVTPQPLPVLQLSTLISPWLTQSPPTDPCVSHIFWISGHGVRQ